MINNENKLGLSCAKISSIGLAKTAKVSLDNNALAEFWAELNIDITNIIKY